MPAALEMSRIEVPSKPFSRNSVAETRSSASRRLLSLLRRAARGLDFIGLKTLPRSFPYPGRASGSPGHRLQRESSSFFAWRWVPAFVGTSGETSKPRQIGGRLDFHAQQPRGDRLAQIVHAQRAR